MHPQAKFKQNNSEENANFIEFTPEILREMNRDTDWNKLDETFENKLNVKIKFIRELLGEIEETNVNDISILIGQELVKGEPDYEIRKTKRRIRESILDSLEKEGFIVNKKYIPKEIEFCSEDDIYVNFDIKSINKTTSILRLKLLEFLKENEKKKKDLKNRKDIRYSIEFTSDRKIILNKRYLIGKPNSFSSNSEYFENIFNNSEVKISKRDLEFDTKLSLAPSKHLRNFVSELGFKGEVRKMFFKVSENEITFYNYISQYDLKEKKINTKKLENEIIKLKEIKPSNKRVKKKL